MNKPGSLSLTRPQKAAAVLVAMGKPAAGRLLKFFKQEELKALIEAARQLKTIPQSELEKIVAEFEAEFAEGAGLLDSADEMDTLLSESLSPEEVKAILDPAQPVPVAERSEPVWPAVEKLDPERLGQFLESEHPQTAALILTKLPSGAAAQVLIRLPRAMRGEVVKRMLAMTPVKPVALELIENQVRRRLLVENAGKNISAGQTRVANVLNELDKPELEEMMADLAAAGTEDLESIRARLFSFEDVVLLDQRSRVALFDGLPAETVTNALRGANAELMEAVLSAIGARTRRMIESELSSGTEGVPAETIQKARKQIASLAIQLAGRGSVTLPSAQAAA
jgi:flagellar motor switch protein FliG